MKVGDLVKNKTNWGGKGTIGIVVSVYDKNCLNENRKVQAVTLNTGWEYEIQELEVLSESR